MPPTIQESRPDPDNRFQDTDSRDQDDAEWFDTERGVGLPWWGTLGKFILQLNKVPNHIAFVMDGNRRYARINNLGSVLKGHSKGFQQMTKILEWCRELGVKEVTVYAFSIQNFNRSEDEVKGLMELAEKKFSRLLEEKEKLKERQICFRFFGDLKLLPTKIQRLVSEIEYLTKDHKNGFVNVCLSYTSQNEIARAMEWIRRGTQMGLIEKDDISESLISRCLDTRKSSEVDMLIRTSGEQRLSDFLLWQCSNCYVHFEDVLWPDLNFWHLFKAILHYQQSRGLIEKIANISSENCDAVNQSRVEKFLQWMEEERLNEIKGRIEL